MIRTLCLLVIAALTLSAQSAFRYNPYTRQQDIAGDMRLIPVGSGVLASRPATCTTGQVYMCVGTGCTNGANVHWCRATDTWQAQSGAVSASTDLSDTAGLVRGAAGLTTNNKLVEVSTTDGTVQEISNQNANVVYAGPASGSAAAPAFRALGVADLPTVDKTRSSTVVINGTGALGVLQDTDDQPAVFYNSLGQGLTITGVSCKTDSATASRIQLQRDDGSAANILTDNTGAGLDCSSTRASGTLDGTEEHIASTNAIDFVMVSAGGAGKWVSVTITYTLD